MKDNKSTETALNAILDKINALEAKIKYLEDKSRSKQAYLLSRIHDLEKKLK